MKKMVLAAVAALIVLLTAITPVYADSAEWWEIGYAYQEGDLYVSGYSCSRGAVADDLYNEIYGYVPGTDTWEWAERAGLMTGSPDRAITKEELATVLYHYAEMRGMKLLPVEKKAANGCSEWATDYCSWAVGIGIMENSDWTSTDFPMLPYEYAELLMSKMLMF